MRVSKKGNQGLGGPAGDLMIQVKVKPHPYFKRDGADIHTELFVSIADVSNILLTFSRYLEMRCMCAHSMATFE